MVGRSRGGTLVEYLVVIGVVVLALAGVFLLFGKQVSAATSCLGQKLGLTGTSACGGGDPTLTARANLKDGPKGPDGLTCGPMGCEASACFAAGTLVATPDGSRAIESLGPGDLVLGADPTTDARVAEPRRVLATKVTADRPLLALTISVDSREETLAVTAEHPFLTLTPRPVWQGAGWLVPGTHLAIEHGDAVVVSVERPQQRSVVFNLEVEGVHTYFVGVARALVHNDYDAADPQGDWTRQQLQLSPPPWEKNPGRDAIGKLAQGKLADWGPLALGKPPASITPAQAKTLEAYKADADAAYKELDAARKASNEYDRANESKAKRTDYANGFSLDYPPEIRVEQDKLRTKTAKAAKDYYDAVAAHFRANDSLKKGVDIAYTGGKQVPEIKYPIGGKTQIEWKDGKVAGLTFVEQDGAKTRVYDSGGGKWKLDIGKGAEDPIAFNGTYTVRSDGAIQRETKTRLTTIAPDGTVTTSYTQREYTTLKSDIGGGLDILFSMGNDHAKMTVSHPKTGQKTEVFNFTSFKGELRPRIIKTEGDNIVISLDGSERAHLVIGTKTQPFAKGIAWSEAGIPYYDEKNLRVILKPLPSGTDALTLTVTSPKAQTVYSWITPLPEDGNYIIGPKWRPGQSGSFEGNPRFGWFRGNQFVADTTASARKFTAAVETYTTTMVRGTPYLGGVVMVTEAVIGTDMTGRDMGARERWIHGGLGTLSVGLDFGPLVMESAQGAKAVAGVEKSMGVSKAEARALLEATKDLTETEKGVLRALGRGEKVPLAQIDPIVTKMDGALARMRVSAGGPETAARVLAAAERRVSLPVLEQCFVAGTRVVTESGERPIEAVEPGTRVRTSTGTFERVVRRFERTSDHRRIVDVRASNGTTHTLETTDEHPIWEETRGFVAAATLRPGDTLREETGEPSTVLGTRRVDGAAPVFNLEVENAHTYFVAGAIGAPAVLVHNRCLGDILRELAITDPAKAQAATRGLETVRALEAEGKMAGLIKAADANPTLEAKLIEQLVEAGKKPGAEVLKDLKVLVNEIEGTATGNGVKHYVNETAATGKYAASGKVTETMAELQKAGVPAGAPITSEFGVAREMVTGQPTKTGAGGYTWHAEKVDTAVRQLDKYASRLREKIPVLERLDPAEAARAKELLKTAEQRADAMRPYLDAWKRRHLDFPGKWEVKDGKIIPKEPMPADPTRGGGPARPPNPLPGETP